MSNAAQSKSIVVLQEGSTGPEVIDLQFILQIRNFTLDAPDGKFGSRTKAAVIKFQKSKKLVAFIARSRNYLNSPLSIKLF
ncbi:MAG: peptidoglycan-binding protein [Hassallia sp. WJT32-NPBG1]|nr:peptidoglycan-binding protein [Hassallia sp. WJT32-NPBG1]